MIEPLPRGGRILDLGCGAGEPIGRFLIARGHSVVGVDHAQSMINLAQTRFPRERWIKADMRTVQFDE
ncbi:class I SAM-dependent methyltransferase, partial [Escherichia coli]|uniref:class I SAM-dependent methyltransferase n=4 Tax=Pseudomonadota TaxID=1224 RepID=UPI000FA02A9E